MYKIIIFLLLYVVTTQFSLAKEIKSKEKHMSELPVQEQIMHKNLMAKFNLLQVYQDYLFSQEQALVKLMEIVENNKNKDCEISQDKFLDLVKSMVFPDIQDLKIPLEKLSTNRIIEYKVNYCLDLIKENNKSLIDKFFTLLENEILSDIVCYEESGSDIPQYRFLLEAFQQIKTSLPLACLIFKKMNPKLFG